MINKYRHPTGKEEEDITAGAQLAHFITMIKFSVVVSILNSRVLAQVHFIFFRLLLFLDRYTASLLGF